MKMKASKSAARYLFLLPFAILLSACGPFSNEPHRTIPTVYREPGVANTPSYSGNPPSVLSPYYPTTDVSPTP
jgi:hypothetical protein